MALNTQDLTADAITATGQVDTELAQIIAPVPSKRDDPYLVAFAEPYDAENPKDWSRARKWAVTDVLSATGFNRIMVSTIMAPALSTIAAELDMSSIESVMSLSIYVLATAIGPLIIGPLSEMYGRTVVLHASNIWFLVFNIACGFANTKGLLIAARFLAGFGASAIYALGGGVLGDVWRPMERGRSLGIYLLIPLLAVAVGPIIGGFMAARTTWRWMFWATSIFQGVMIAVAFTTYKETHGPTILKKRAARLRRETGNQQYHTSFERLDENKSLLTILGRNLSRPLRLLAFNPVIQIASLIMAFYYGVLYLVLTSFATLWTDQYHQPVEVSGLHYIACALGEMAGSQVGGPLIDFMYRKQLQRQRRRTAESTGEDEEEEHVPEHRIPLMIPAAFLGPLGLFIYGWTAAYGAHWLAVDAGVFLYLFGAQIAGMPLQAYLIDAYPEHTSSAMAATQFLESTCAFLFPLFAPAMYSALGYGWGNSTIAFIALFVGVPAPLALWYWGARLRARSTSTY